MSEQTQAWYLRCCDKVRTNCCFHSIVHKLPKCNQHLENTIPYKSTIFGRFHVLLGSICISLYNQCIDYLQGMIIFNLVNLIVCCSLFLQNHHNLVSCTNFNIIFYPILLRKFCFYKGEISNIFRDTSKIYHEQGLHMILCIHPWYFVRN